MSTSKPHEDALAAGHVAAWDWSAPNDHSCGIYELGPDHAKLIVHDKRARDTATIANLEARGVRIGSVYRSSEYLWIIEGADCEVWSTNGADGVLLRNVAGQLALKSRTLDVSEVVAVISFYDDADYGHRGVKLALKNEEVLVAEEHDPAAELDVTYGWDNLLVDGGWISHLGRDLATCLGVPHQDQLHPTQQAVTLGQDKRAQGGSEHFSITLEQGNEAAPDSPWGYQRVAVTANGQVEYEQRARGRTETLRGRINREKVASLQEALRKTTFPQPPQATFVPGSSICALTRSPPAERVLIDYFDGARMEGYRDVLRELAALRNALREGNIEVLASWQFTRDEPH